MKTIFLAEGEKHVREAIRLRLAHQSGFIVVGEATTPESLLARVCRHPPDAILLDWCLPGLHPQRLLDALRQCCPETIILATSVQPEHESIAQQFGVDAFLSKQLPPDEFIDSLKAATNRNSSYRDQAPCARLRRVKGAEQ